MKTFALLPLAALALAACSSEPDKSELNALDNQLANADPALTSALEDQITVDPALTQQSNRNAARATPSGQTAQYPRGQAAQAASCADKLDYNAGWARRLPAGFAVYPGGRVTEAAGSDTAPCAMRVVTFASNAGWRNVVDWYRDRAVGAGFSAEEQARDGDRVLAGVKGDAAYYLIVTPKGTGSDVALIASSGV